VSDFSQPGEPVWAQLSPDVQQSLMGAFARIDQLSKRLDVAIINPPAPGSAAELETANKSQAYAYNIAATTLQSAVDHLRAWRKLVEAGLVPMYAHMSLLRTAFESALLAYWLFEPGIDAIARHARAIAAQAEEYDERRKFEESWGRTTPPAGGKLAVDRLADLVNGAAQLGFTQVNRKGDQVLTTVVPRVVELFDRYEPAAAPAASPFQAASYSVRRQHTRPTATRSGPQRSEATERRGCARNRRT
jgi:hypothetical protein